MRYEDKIKEVEKLLKEKKKIEEKLKGLLEPETIIALPRGFSVSAEVLRLVKESGTEGISSLEILTELQKQYPNGVDREKVASALAYFKNTKNLIETTARGVYRMKTQTPNSPEQGSVKVP